MIDTGKSNPPASLTYKDSGVDIDKADTFIKDIAPLIKKTFRKEVLTDIGSFSALFRLDITKFTEPVLVSGTDGVGTKLKIAFMAGRHDTIGIDLVAMCVNDVLTSGAEPLFFLDYLAVSSLDPHTAGEIIKGIAEGCKEAGCALIGGETAEMPGFYSNGEYDVAGFCVGAVNKPEIIDGSSIVEGDTVIGLASSGLHSNGYSLARKLFFETEGHDVNAFIPELGKTIGEELLTPTKIYVKAVFSLKSELKIKGMAHITGGGITGNLPRILPAGFGASIDKSSWEASKIFGLIRNKGIIAEDEMFKTFNMGIGYTIVTPKEDAARAVEILNGMGQRTFIIGNIVKGSGVIYN
ncbi:phosphoribosylformylglycinamidine cyclo-ligase [Candidatus Magnetominusculus xianensis]|uniref:Phosphoribosylformylglycinamidine cyclo-ligase n=1 Tax=Candidatus Magnetominusculus xianensis TaxID=1748249 RepID=A0ABR5SGQ8_9BACT|nr:phosphoribosylformylglycinamidine cyclo-ligase [Candidatus Magnetominusculus xianensis]KWT90503.1 phosphoribosylformylglycinamidine cyclo-ligase [Candidatus Magnetominusculus xianensis]MBF0404171.1 phosphoribosylformylglycinamidine cyclo-ligase [Nitrospirota bacterium]